MARTRRREAAKDDSARGEKPGTGMRNGTEDIRRRSDTSRPRCSVRLESVGFFFNYKKKESYCHFGFENLIFLQEMTFYRKYVSFGITISNVT